MKQFLLFLTFLTALATVHAQTSGILINESFESYNNGNLNGQGTWASGGSNGYKPQVSGTALTYAGYPSGAKSVSLTRGGVYVGSSAPYFFTPDDPYRGFTNPSSLSTGTATTFFMSFLVRVPATSGTSSTGSARPTVSLRTSLGDNLMNFYVASNGSNVKFGVQKDEDADGSYQTGAGTNFNTNTTYLIVMRYDLRTSNSSDDRIYLWVNPALNAQPQTSSAIASATAGSDGITGSINSLQLFQQDNSATVSVDAFKIAYARNFGDNNAAAWEALSPGAAPLPVTFGEIKAYDKDDDIQVDWTVHTEINVSHYDVERSTDGVSFSKIGSVTAQAKDGVLYYTYVDAMAAAGVSFYRVRNVDLDGKYSYRAIVKVSGGKSIMENVSVYPNPIQNNRVNLQTGNLAKGNYVIDVLNAAGQQVYRQTIKHTGGASIRSVQLPGSTHTGIYTIRLSGDDVKVVKQFLVP